MAFSIFFSPATCPFAGIVVISFLSSQRLQCIDFKPVSSQVASLSTVKSLFQSCPKDSTFSVFVFPQTVHSNVFTPSSVHVGSVVIVPGFHL